MVSCIALKRIKISIVKWWNIYGHFPFEELKSYDYD